jgi:hypothetical protein
MFPILAPSRVQTSLRMLGNFPWGKTRKWHIWLKSIQNVLVHWHTLTHATKLLVQAACWKIFLYASHASQDLRFPQWYCWMFKSSSLQWMVSSYWYFKRKRCLHLQSHAVQDMRDEGTTVLQNLSNCLLINMVQHPRRVESSSPASS